MKKNIFEKRLVSPTISVENIMGKKNIFTENLLVYNRYHGAFLVAASYVFVIPSDSKQRRFRFCKSLARLIAKTMHVVFRP